MRNPVFPKVDDNIPNYIKEEYPTFHRMVVDYFKWLEKDENFLRVLTEFKDNLEIDNQVKPYIDIIKKELGWFYDVPLKIDDRTLIKSLRDFYLSRGNVKSFKILFKILFNENVDIFYPREKLLKLSDNNYLTENRILTSAENLSFPHLIAFSDEILSISIVGIQSGQIAIVDNITPILLNQNKYLRINLSETNNDFIPLENVEIRIEGLVPFIEKIYSSTKLEILDRGYGYKVNDEIIIEGTTVVIDNKEKIIGGPNVRGKIIIDDVSLGGIDKIGIVSELTPVGSYKIFKSGKNYKNNDLVNIKSGKRNGWGFDARVVVHKVKKASIDYKINDGVIESISISPNTGIGYSKIPNIKVLDTRPINFGTGAEVKVTEIVKDYVGEVKIVYNGNNYVGGPSVLFSDPNGNTATGNTTLLNDAVSQVNIINGGSGYSVPPKVIFSASIGKTALGTAVLSNDVVTNVIINDPGYGYTTPPAISFEAPLKRMAIGIAILNGDAVSSVFLIDSGSGYRFGSTITFSAPATGTRAIGSVNTLNGKINTITIVTAGSGYSAPVVTISAPESGTRATGQAVVENGRIKKVILTNKGNGYLTTPTITITQGANQSASANTVLMGSVKNISVISGGKNYNPKYIKFLIDPPESSQPSGNLPILTPTIIDGVIADLKIIDPGEGFSIIPQMILKDFGSGTNFSANLRLDDTKLILNNYIPGKNYSKYTKIEIDEPTDIGQIAYIDVLNSGFNFSNLDEIELDIISEKGEGAELYPLSTSIGKIKKIKVLEDYWNYDIGEQNTPEPKVSIISQFGKLANIKVNKNNCINRDISHNENSIGLLGINAFLHDSYYYQQFSYETKSRIPTLYSKEIIDDLLHPIGLMKFNVFHENATIEMPIIYTDNILDIIIKINLNTKSPFKNADEMFFLNILENSYYDVKENYLSWDALFDADNKLITFDINTAEELIFESGFNFEIDYFKDYSLALFLGEKEIAELATLDFEIGTPT